MITTLPEGCIFVFGSNLRGIHGKGAARDALKWGAKKGVGLGFQGRTFAIPTKLTPYTSLKLHKIKQGVDWFTRFAKNHPEYKFLVTAIGCGYAGYEPRHIAPMFEQAFKLENVYLPEEFIKILNNEKT